MTKQEAAIVSAYTWVMLGEFNEMVSYIEKILERPIFLHELGDPEVYKEIHNKSKQDFMNLIVE